MTAASGSMYSVVHSAYLQMLYKCLLPFHLTYMYEFTAYGCVDMFVEKAVVKL